jgi:hypothetical protein
MYFVPGAALIGYYFRWFSGGRPRHPASPHTMHGTVRFRALVKRALPPNKMCCGFQIPGRGTSIGRLERIWRIHQIRE